MRMIPWEEVKAEWIKEPGYAEAYAQAKRELDEEVAKYGTIGNPKPTPKPTPKPRPVFTKSAAKVRRKQKISDGVLS